MNFSESISLVANICTIVGFFIAVYLFCIWKDQQNYSFVRDKIFEVELVYARLLISMKDYLKLFKNELPFAPNRIATEVVDITNVFLREHKEDINKYTGQYEDALFGLHILGVKYNDELVANHVIIHSRFNEYIGKLKECTTKEEVTLLHRKFNQLLVEEKKTGLKELQTVRRKI